MREGTHAMNADLPSRTPSEDDRSSSSQGMPIFLPENDAEIARLLLTHRYINEQLGGVLPSSLNLSHVERVLDVGCNVGGWVYDMAWQHPLMEIIGVDARDYFVDQAQCLLKGLKNASVIKGDIYHLDTIFSHAELFDLVHLRRLIGTVPIHAFPALLQSLTRLLKAESYLIWTEIEFPLTTSPACQRMFSWVATALHNAATVSAHSHTPANTAPLGHLLREVGCRIEQDVAYAVDISKDTRIHEGFERQYTFFANQVRDFLLHAGVTTEKAFEETFAAMQREILDKDFCGIVYTRTVVGRWLSQT
jgi:SAM-dependent methyltransferase